MMNFATVVSKKQNDTVGSTKGEGPSESIECAVLKLDEQKLWGILCGTKV